MHKEAKEWVSRFASDLSFWALDIGGRDINGQCRDMFPNARWTVLDIAPGDGVDIVADAGTWQPDRQYDLVLCTEVFEHTAIWRAICSTAFAACAPGGRFIVTCAGPGRHPHSAIDGMGVRPDEYYGNVDPFELHDWLRQTGWDAAVDYLGTDTRAYARKPR